MTYEEWETSTPRGIRGDAIWKVQAFRLSSYLAAVADLDAESVDGQPRLAKAATQLSSAAASIPANIAEGYVRLSPRDRVRYYEYALGSAAEAKSWYISLSRAVPVGVIDARLLTLTSISRLLLKMIHSGRLQATNGAASSAFDPQAMSERPIPTPGSSPPAKP
jgi:four helix bundle protein